MNAVNTECLFVLLGTIALDLKNYKRKIHVYNGDGSEQPSISMRLGIVGLHKSDSVIPDTIVRFIREKKDLLVQV